MFFSAGTAVSVPLWWQVSYINGPPQGKGIFGVEPTSQNSQLQIAAATWRIETRSDSAFSGITLDLLS